MKRRVTMKLLILGGTGVISRAIVKNALIAGYDVTVFNRGSHSELVSPQVKVITGDKKDNAAFAELMKDADYDTVIDMICFNENDAKQTWETFNGKVRQIIFTSSIAAYDRPYHSFPIREDAEALRTDPAFGYGFNKAEMERYLNKVMDKDGQTAITIIRPSLTFGPGAANFGILRQNINVVKRIENGLPVVMTGEGCIPWTFTFVEDLSMGFVLACGNEKTYNEAFNVTNDELVCWEDLYLKIGEIVGREPQLCYISSKLLKDAYPAVCGHLYYEKVHYSYFSTEKFRKASPAFSPKVRLKDGLAEVIDWWRATGFPVDEKKMKMEDEICACYGRFSKEICEIVKNNS